MAIVNGKILNADITTKRVGLAKNRAEQRNVLSNYVQAAESSDREYNLFTLHEPAVELNSVSVKIELDMGVPKWNCTHQVYTLTSITNGVAKCAVQTFKLGLKETTGGSVQDRLSRF